MEIQADQQVEQVLPSPKSRFRVIARRVFKYGLIAALVGTLGITVEAIVRGRLTSPEQRVVSALHTRPSPWSGGRSQTVAFSTLDGQPLEARIPVSLSDVPDALVQAVLAVEDQRFYQHFGLDSRRIAGAMVANIRAGGISQGGSTLTQQLAKNLYLSHSRTVLRKVREAALALALEARYDKDRILEAYLNEIYLGQDGGRPIHGVGAAAQFYFGKDVERIGVAESALLAGMIQAPNRYAPARHPESARDRRNLVLSLMTEQLRVNGPAARRAAQSGVSRREHPTSSVEGRWFRDYAGNELPKRTGDRGVAVYTTMDAALQRAAEQAVTVGVNRLRRNSRNVEAALVALDPRSGEILAMVGGSNYSRSQFNRATQARRQPGSAFKPIVALAALERQGKGAPEFTLASMVQDEPLRVRAGGEMWQPANYDGEFRGQVTFREAMEQSLNVPFARIGMQVGAEKVISTARRLGISGKMQPVPSLALGSAEVTLLELARAYGVFATQGELATTRAVIGSGQTGTRFRTEIEPIRSRVADPAATFLVTSMLQGVVDHGTGRALNNQGRFEGIAGKTGTTNDWRDAWFVAYSPALVVAVWVGRDDGQSIGMTGATAALPIAASFLGDIVPRSGWDAPNAPDGIVQASVMPSGGDWYWGCGRSEYFLAGTEPSDQGCSRGNWGGEWGNDRGDDWGDVIRGRLREELRGQIRGEDVLEELYRRWGDRLEGEAARLVEQALEQVRKGRGTGNR